MKRRSKDQKSLDLMGKLIDLGDSLREKLDKRGYHGSLSAGEMLSYWLDGNQERTKTEVISSMRQFIATFEELSRGTK